MEIRRVKTDILIIGGGTAGCYAAVWLGEHTALSVAVAEKAAIRRSGCLAAGVNALNAYITEGHVPKDYADYAAQDANGIVRPDLLLTMAERLNDVTHDMERRGLTILKDEQGRYVSRGWRNLKINGENIKPLLADEVRKQARVDVYEHVNVTDYLLADDPTGKRRIAGAAGFGLRDGAFYEFRARAVIIATGGAAGLYRPNNPGRCAHKMWYCPFNTGAGYAMGLMAGAEMTTFEMRFIALRCKDTIAPTGTIAQGVGAKQINAMGEIYEDHYGLKTAERLWGTVMENREGRGPCFLKTTGISAEQERDLYHAYLNMAPSQTLQWLSAGAGPAAADVEIEGTEPYVVGGHTASGYWVDSDRASTIPGLFAAGDVAGGAPQKYVTGALAEAVIAAESAARFLSAQPDAAVGAGSMSAWLSNDAERIRGEYESFLARPATDLSAPALEDAMQKIMDDYAGGIRTDYRYTEAGLGVADRHIRKLQGLLADVSAQNDMDRLLAVYEVRERLIVCRALIAHLAARKETRWRGFQENADYPGLSADGERYVNSRMENGEIRTFFRELVREGARYEHPH